MSFFLVHLWSLQVVEGANPGPLTAFFTSATILEIVAALFGVILMGNNRFYRKIHRSD